MERSARGLGGGDGALGSALVREKRIAVADFARFGSHAVNPSEQVVRALAGEPGLSMAELPVSYRRAESQLVATFESASPTRPALRFALSG